MEEKNYLLEMVNKLREAGADISIYKVYVSAKEVATIRNKYRHTLSTYKLEVIGRVDMPHNIKMALSAPRKIKNALPQTETASSS